MKYSISVNPVKNKESNLRGFASVVFGDVFKITNIAILENTDKGQLFVSMPRYKSSEKDENNKDVYKDICNPISKEFREELYGNILETYEAAAEKGEQERFVTEGEMQEPEFSVRVSVFEREDSNIRGLARIFLEDSFVINNVTLLQGSNDMFVSMPSYKTKQTDEQGKTVYQDVCYPVTKEFREKLYPAIFEGYHQAKEEKLQKEAQEKEPKKKSHKEPKKNEQQKEEGKNKPMNRREKIQRGLV